MLRKIGILVCFLLLLSPAQALDIKLTSGDWQPISLFVEPFRGEQNLSKDIPSVVIGNDLAASGYFRVAQETSLSDGEIDETRLRAISQQGGEYLLTGAIFPEDDGRYKLRFVLYDTLIGSSVGSYNMMFGVDNQRSAAHQVSNWIYEKIAQKQGVFHTKVAYVLRHEDGKNELRIADYDGYNRQTVLSSNNTIISPTWSPDGNTLLYVSFEKNKPVIYSQSLLTGKRRLIANFKGSNSAPAMGPNRQRIAAALTVHGGQQQIYIISDNGKVRLRTSDGIDTEPVFSPDGNRLAFTSDESGTPQIYEYDLDRQDSRRLTYGSRYSASPDYSSDGNALIFIQRDGKGDNIALLDLQTMTTSVLTATRLADSPSFAPNDDLIVFKSNDKRRHLATVSINGRVATFWAVPEAGEVIDPSWSPVDSDWF